MEKRFVLTSGTGEEKADFRFGLLLNGNTIEAWQAETIRLLKEDGHQLVFVGINATCQKKGSLTDKLINYPYSRLLFRIWNRFIFKPSAKNPTNVTSLIAGASVIPLNTTVKGSSTYFSDTDVSMVKSFAMDFILRFGFNIIRGSILDAAKFGIWSFHHDDEMKYRGGPPGFWEFMKKEADNGVILQRLTNQLDKGILLQKNWYPVIYHAYTAHLNQLYNESTKLPLQYCRQLQSGEVTETQSATKAKIYHPPGNLKMLHYAFLAVYRRISFHLKDLLRQEDWHIGYEDFHDNPDCLSNDIFQKINRSSRTTYLADPFIISHKGETYFFAEEFDYKKGKGKLVVAKKSEDFMEFYTILEDNHHYSFPFVFENEGNLFVIPECFESGEVKIYQFDTVSLKLSFVQTLLKGYAAVDPIVFRRDGRWWLLFTLKSMPSVHLYVFYAESLFGEYKPHFNNPVKSDIRTARNAGAAFVKGSKLFRPAQDCSAHYGRAVNICEITALSENSFSEVISKRIEPIKRSGYSTGLHTYNFSESICVVDGKRYISTWYGFLHSLKKKISRRK